MQFSPDKQLKYLAIVYALLPGTLVAQSGPGGVSGNLHLWLKANTGTNCSVGGCGITSWSDQSPGVNHATGTGNATYLTSFSNFNPGLSFTDDVQPISGPISRPGGTASTIIVVGSVPAITDGGLVELGTGGSRAYMLDRRYSATPVSYSLQLNAPTIWVVSDLGGALDADIHEQGRRFYTQAKTENTDWTVGASYFIGDDQTGGNRLTGDIAEVIFYDQLIDPPDQQKVESYLAIKYGITLSSDNNNNASTFESPNAGGINEGDYVSGAGAVLWDASLNSAFHNDVAGIGRSDTSALNQQKSLSANSDGMVILDKGMAFASDEDFILWGNDNGAVALTPADKDPAFDLRLTR